MIKNIKNAYYSILDTIFLPFAMLAVTPIFISGLGIGSYGMWMLINSLLTAMSILNIGGVDTIIKYISHYRADNDIKSINEVFSTIFITQIFFAIIIVLISFYLPHFLVYSSVFNIETTDYKIFEVSLQFGILLFAIKLVEQVLYAYFKGYERFDIASKFSMLSKALLIIIQLITVLNDGTLDNVFINSFLFAIGMLFVEIAYAKYKYENIKFLGEFHFDRLKEVFTFTKWSWIISIVGTASSQIDRWLIASLANMQMLGYYSLAILIFKNLHAVMASSMSWVFPKVSKETNKNKILEYYFILQGFLLFSSMLISYILIEFDELFLLWLKEETFNNSKIYIDTVLLFLPIYSVSIIPFYIVKGSGFIKHNFISDTMTLTIRIVAILILYKLYGLLGVVIAVGISGMGLAIYLLIILQKKIFYNENLKIASTLLLPLLFIFALLKIDDILSFISWGALVVIYYVIFVRNLTHIWIKR